jgi:hypothetical protein
MQSELVNPAEQGRFSPDALSHEERFNIGGLFASLVLPSGPHRRRGLKALKAFFRYLNLTPEDQQALVGLTCGSETRNGLPARSGKTMSAG